MARRTDTMAPPRAPLSKERVLRGAVDLADANGIDALSMRKLGQALGVEAMSLYNHAASKEDILDGVVDLVIAEIAVVSADGDWKVQLRQQILAARQAMLRHPWAARVLETRPDPGPAGLRYLDLIIGILRTGGFSVDMTHHAMHGLGSRVFGFNQELFDTTRESGTSPEVSAIMARDMAERFPHVTELAMAVSHQGGLGGCDDDIEFAFGLDLILDGLERYRDRG